MERKFQVAVPEMTILSDHPSRAGERSPDLLALEGRLASVFDILRHKNTECPVTVAIYGDWGTGKTSAMRWLETQLCTWNELPPEERKGHPKVHPVWFDPWRYHTREDVWRGIIAEVVLSLFKVKAIRKENFLQNLRLAAKHFGAFLGRGFLHALAHMEVEVEAGGPKASFSGEAFRDIFEEWNRTTHPEKAFLNQFEDTLKGWLAEFFPRDKDTGIFQERLVLFIDDLDRCLPAVTLEVLEALKLYLNLEPIMFVVGLDREVVDAVVTEHYKKAGLGPEKARLYLNKLFQVEIQVPASDAQVGAYSKALIQRLNKETGDYWRENLGDGTIARETLDEGILYLAAGNPREVKRLLNSALVRGHSAASNLALAETEDQKKARFAQGVAFYLLQRFLRERAFSETLFLRDESLEWFQRASEWRQANHSNNHAIFVRIAESGKSGGSVSIKEVQELLESRPVTLRAPAFDQCLAHEWFWRLLEIPFDAAVGRQAPRIESRRTVGAVVAPLDLFKFSEVVRARLAMTAGKTLDTLTAADLEGVLFLNLSSLSVTDEALKEISRVATLQELLLDDTPITDEGLTEISRLTALQILSLDYTRLSNAGMENIAQLTALRELSLSYTQITGAGLEKILAMPKMEKLWLKRTKVTDAEITAFKKARPDIVIVN